MNEEIPLEIGQVWKANYGSVEIVALGPEHVACIYRYVHQYSPYDGSYSCYTKGYFRTIALKLIPPPKPKHELWLNVYSNCDIGRPYPTKDDADLAMGSKDRIACIKVEFQEGDGLI